MIRIRVPGTTANLGPGFDSLGCALTVYGDFYFETREEGLQFENIVAEYCNEDNLAVKAYRRALREIGVPERGLYLKIASDIPTSRGLGSSASLIAAGLTAANVLNASPLPAQRLLELATELEGHPDNVAPALFGGLTASLMAKGRVCTMRCPVADNIRFCALIPDFELPTRLARQALPEELPFRDAVYNISRATVLVKAFETGDLDALQLAMNDRLHQPYRRHLIAEYDLVEEMARENGAAGFCLSGAGPTLLCIPRDADFEDAMEKQLPTLAHKWQLLRLQVDAQGARVIGEGEA